MAAKEQLAVGSRVTLDEHSGIVEHITDEHVRVRWDDGCIGILYFDREMLANAFKLSMGKADQDA